jgi:NTE family protein
LKNYAGRCDYVLLPQLEQLSLTYRQREMRENLMPVLDSKEKPCIHLIDGGVADNLGLRAIAISRSTSPRSGFKTSRIRKSVPT